MGIGLTEYLLIAVVLLLLFGPKKLPELGRALGKTLREFKKGAQNMVEEDDAAKDKQPLQPGSAETTVIPPVPEKKETDSRRLPE